MATLLKCFKNLSFKLNEFVFDSKKKLKLLIDIQLKLDKSYEYVRIYTM